MAPDGTYIRVSDHLPEHPKISAVGGEAGWLFVAGLCYCSRNLTDGFIPATVVARLTDLRRPNVLVGRLVEVGLWHGPDHACTTCPPAVGGFVVHDYLAYQRSAAQVADIKAKRAAAGRRGGQAKAQSERRAGTSPAVGQVDDSGAVGKVPADWQDGVTGPLVATVTPEAEADVSVPAVRETPMPGAEKSPPPVGHRARDPDVEPGGALDVDGLVAQVRALRPEWTPARIRAAVTHPRVRAHPVDVVAAAALIVAADPDTRHPGRLRHAGPWWEQARARTNPSNPPAGLERPRPRPAFDPVVNARGLAATRTALAARARRSENPDTRSEGKPNPR